MTHYRSDGLTNLKDEARTPYSLFSRLDETYGFILDSACTRSNCLCNRGFFHDEGKDALKENWLKHSEGDYIWCNPPYSKPGPFIQKAYEESQNGAKVVMLLPADTSTKAFHKYCMQSSEIIFIKGRVTFNNPNGTPIHGSPKFGSMIVVFDMANRAIAPRIRSMEWK